MLLALKDEIRHFGSSACAGLGAYCLTWTTLRFWSYKASQSRGKTWPGEQDARCMFRLCWSVALFVSFLVHCMLDGVA